MTASSPEAPEVVERSTASPVASYDGVDAPALADQLTLPRLVVYDVVGSTMDVAHALAADGAGGGTAVLADTQVAGRGRHGRAWQSDAGQGIWLTLIERPVDTSGLEVLSLRVGLALADALQPLAPSGIRLKWPNDVFVSTGKLAGVLIEARWRHRRLDWLAIGVGLNVRERAGERAGFLRPGVTRIDALARVVAAVRRAAATPGALTPDEVTRFHARDLAVGRLVTSPSAGVVAGIDATGAVTIAGSDGARTHRAGSLIFAEDA